MKGEKIMKKTKEQKAITLVALIITIVVLLILAAVAISSIQNDGILGYAGNAAGAYDQSVKNESGTLGGYDEFFNKYTDVQSNLKPGEIAIECEVVECANNSKIKVNILVGGEPYEQFTTRFLSNKTDAEVEEYVLKTFQYLGTFDEFLVEMSRRRYNKGNL